MSINLASRLSAIATDFAGVNHIVWVEDGAIWHAQFDANAGRWVNAQQVVGNLTENVTSLNLTANEKLIGGDAPGLAVIWQQGDEQKNSSNFQYSAAQYGSDGQLQWDATPTQFTVNESTGGQPFTNLAPRAIADNDGNITVVGQQVNLINANNQSLREDTDLYTSSLSIQSVTPGTASTPNAYYEPPVIVDGVNPVPVSPVPATDSNTSGSAEIAVAATQSFSTLTNEPSSSDFLSLTTNSVAATNVPSQSQWSGLQANGTLSFTTNLFQAFGLDKYLDGVPEAALKLILDKYVINGTLSVSTIINTETTFTPGESSPAINLIKLGSTGKVTRASKTKKSRKLPGELALVSLVRTFEELQTSISFQYLSESSFQPPSPDDATNVKDYDLTQIKDQFSVTLNVSVGPSSKYFQAQLTGSAGIGVRLILKPNSPTSGETLLDAGLTTLLVDAGTAAALGLFFNNPLQEFQSGFSGDRIASAIVANTVFLPIENALLSNLTDASNLDITEFSVGPTVGVTGNLRLGSKFVNLSGSAGITLFFGLGNNSKGIMTIPISVGFTTGPLTFSLSDKFQYFWDYNATLPSSATSAASAAFMSNAVAENTFNSFALTATDTTPTATASVTGSLLTLNFDQPLDTTSVPAASEFSLSTQSLDQQQPSTSTTQIHNVTVKNDPTSGNGVVVLQLTEPIPYSPQFSGTNPQPAGQMKIFLSYTGTSLKFSGGTAVANLPDLTVANNSPQALAIAFNPTKGNGNDYSAANQTTFLSRLEADYAQDSPPALTLVSSTTNAEGQVLAVWSREVQPLTPIAGFVNGDEVYLNFVQALNTSSTPSNDQFTVLVNGAASDITVTNVAIKAGGYLKLNLSQPVTSTDTVSISYQLSATSLTDNLYLTDAVSSQLWIPAFSETLTNTTSQSSSAAPTLLGGGVIIDNGGVNNLVTLIFNSDLNSSNQPNGSAFTVVNNGVTLNSNEISNVTVSGNVVTFNLPAPNATPLISQGDITTVTYTPGSEANQNLTGSNGVAVSTVSTQLTTLPETPTTTLMAGLYTPGSTSGLTEFQNIPGTDGFNLNPAVASDSSGNALAVWVYADTSDIENLSTPGQFYTDNQSQVILDNLNQSNIYFSYWNGTDWSLAAPLATAQPGTDNNVTIAYDETSQTYIAAWLNTQEDATTGDDDVTIYWASYDPSNSTWSSVNQVLSEATPDPLTDLVISSVNGKPALFWTETQPISYAQLTEENNPFLYFRLGELSGTTANNSGIWGAGAQGTYNGTYTLNETGALFDSQTASGDPNPAVLFSDGGTVTLGSSLNVGGSAFSVEFWFKVPSVPSTSTNLVSLDGVFSTALSQDSNGDAILTFDLGDSSSSSIATTASTNPISADTWYYVVGTYSNQTQELSLYLNGQPVQTLDNVSATFPTSAAFTLAGGTESVYLDEVALYGTALSYSATTTSVEDMTGLDLIESLMGTNVIGEKYGAQYAEPLPPGPQLQFSLLDSDNTWSTQSQINPIPSLEPTQLSDANAPVWDVVSDATPNGAGNIAPNGQPDTIFSTTINGFQGKTIESITLTLSNGQTYRVGGSSADNQLGVVIGDSLINSPAPNASFSYTILGSTLDLDLLVDTGSDPSSSITATGFTLNFTDGTTASNTASGTSQINLPQFVPPKSVPVSLDNVTVSGKATVTETEDSSLTLIDSGFIINTANPFVGYAIVSADFNNDGKSDVAVGNRGYTDTSGTVLNNGTIQILMGGQSLLMDGATGDLSTPTSVDNSSSGSGNTGGFSIVGIPDGGQANGQFPLSMATGDVNNDGYIDLVIGSPNNSTVYVIYGSYLASTAAETVIDVANLTSAQGYSIASPNTSGGDSFGFAVTVGNFNGAGGADVAIGAPSASNGQGEVFVAYDGSSSVTKIYTGSIYTNPTTQETIGEQAGYALATSAYVSNNNSSTSTFSGSTTTDDLIVGAPNHTIAVNNNWTGASGLPTNDPNPFVDSTPVAVGAVYVFTSSSGRLESSPSYTYLGTESSTPSANGAAQPLFAGSALASDDWNGDKKMDLAIAAPGADQNDGTVYVLSGAKASTGKQQYLNQTSDLIINGGLPLSQTGAVVASAGDINNDKIHDLLITAPQGANGTGQSYVVFGQSDLLPNSSTEAWTTETYDLNVTANDDKATLLLNGSEPYQLAGQAAAPIGDINDDGVDDLMISAPNANQLYAVYGHPWLADDGSLKLANISGDNGFVIDGDLYRVENQTLTGTGNNVAMLGDINGDGFADVLAGGSPYGAVVTFGASTQDLLDAASGTDELVITIANDGAIQDVLALGDFNGDGLQDLGIIDTDNNFYVVLGSSSLGTQKSYVASYPTVSLSAPSWAPPVASVGDYNGDGYDDILLISIDSQTLYLGNSSANFDNSQSFGNISDVLFNGIGDINGDSFADLGVGAPYNNKVSAVSALTNGQATVYFGNQSASASTNTTINPPTASLSADLNNNDWVFYTSGSGSDSNSSLSGQQTGSAPSFAVFNGYLYMLYTGTDDELYLQRSADGYAWEGLTNLGFKTYSQASLAAFNNNLYLAFTETKGQVMLALPEFDSSTSLGFSFSSSFQIDNQTANSGPTLVVYDDMLYVFFEAQDDSNPPVRYNYSSNPSDSNSWNNTANTIGNQLTSNRIGAAVLPGDANNGAGTLVVTFKGSGSGDIYVSTYAGGTDPSNGEPIWTTNPVTGQTTNSGPSLVEVNGTLYLFFLADGSYDLNYVTSKDGSTWGDFNSIPGQSTEDRPTPVYFQESILVGFMAYSSTDQDINVVMSNPIYEANQTQQFGSQLQPIGDFNGDGIADFAVLAPGFLSNLGSWNNNLLENNQGAVFIYYGSTSGLSSDATPDVALVLPAPNDSTNVANNQAILLTELAGAGDINGDGFDDLVIASPNTAQNSNNTPDGTNFVIFGGDDTLWSKNYPATPSSPTTSRFNLGKLTSNTSQITLYFSNPLTESNVPATSAFTVKSGQKTISVQSLTFDNPNQLTLTLESDANTSDPLSITYTAPSSGTGLTYASGTQVANFTASDDAAIATPGAPIIDIETYPQYGFSITGLPGSQAGVSLGGGGDVNGDGFSDFIIGAPGFEGSDNLTYILFGSDFNHTVNQTGTIGDDVMEGTPTGESFVAGQGDDFIETKGGADVVYAGPGGDYVTVSDTYFRRLDGGTGQNVLFFEGYNGQDWDLTTLSPGMRLRNFEVLVTEDFGANTLTLNSLTVTELSPTNTVTVYLDEEDQLVLSSDFSYVGTVYQDNQQFSQYTSNQSAATVLSNQLQPPLDFASNAPSLINNNGMLYLAFQGNKISNSSTTENNLIYFTTSSDGGQTWLPVSQLSSDFQTDAPPALAFYKGVLYLAYLGKDTNELNLISSTDNGQTWSPAVTLSSQTSGAGISLVEYQDNLMAFFVADNSNSDILYVYSNDPGESSSWSTAAYSVANPGGGSTYPNQTSSDIVSATVLNDTLYLAYRGGTVGSGNNYYVTSTKGDTLSSLSWSVTEVSNATNPNTAPGLTNDGNQLYLTYGDSTTNQDLYYLTSSNGNSWSDATVISNQTSGFLPSATTVNNNLYVGYTSDDNHIYVTNLVDIEQIGASNQLQRPSETLFTAPLTNTPQPIFPDSSSDSESPAVASSLAFSTTSDFSTPTSLTTTLAAVENTLPSLPTRIYVSNPIVSERTGRADFTLTRTGDLEKYVWVDYLTQDGDAKAGDRYNPVAGQAVFAPGETTKTVTVPIPNNGQYVGDRQFGLAVTLEGESLDPSVVPDTWQAAIATPNEQIRRWNRIPGENGDSVVFDITSNNSADRIVTFDVDLDGMVMPLIWNPATESYENVPFSDVNGITQFQDIDGDRLNDLYRMQFQDGGPFDGDRLVNGLVALDFKLAQLKPVDVPSTGGRIEGTEGNDYISTQNSTGTNRLQGLGGMDILLGSPQRDVLIGGDSNDQLFGGAGVDQLLGEVGNDTLDGGTGLDFLYGGAGADNFVLRAGDGPDRVMDFNATEGDLFVLDQISFGSLTFNSNQILLGSEILAIAVDNLGNPITDFAANPQWFIPL